MSLLPPSVFNTCTVRPRSFLDPHFGKRLNDADLLMAFAVRQGINRHFGYFGPRSQDIGSEILIDKAKFQVNLDVQHCNPNEITVKAAGNNTIALEPKFEEKQGEYGCISRQFGRNNVLPKGYNVKQIKSKL